MLTLVSLKQKQCFMQKNALYTQLQVVTFLNVLTSDTFNENIATAEPFNKY